VNAGQFREQAWEWFQTRAETQKLRRESPARTELREEAEELSRIASDVARRALDPRTTGDELATLTAQVHAALGKLRGDEVSRTNAARLAVLRAIDAAGNVGSPRDILAAIGASDAKWHLHAINVETTWESLKRALFDVVLVWHKRGARRTGVAREKKWDAASNVMSLLGMPITPGALKTLWHESQSEE
jgi:hypothetical protein